MTAKHLYSAGILLMIGATACNNNGTPASGNSDSSTVTTTTTTTTVHHRYNGSFIPQPATKYIDLKTNKEVTVRIDTTLGQIVNDETNEPVDLFVAPITHDTIYGLTGTVVNNYVIHEPSGELHVDTVKINQMQANTTMDDGGVGKEKYKEKENGKVKYKDDSVKVKEKNGVQITTQK